MKTERRIMRNRVKAEFWNWECRGETGKEETNQYRGGEMGEKNMVPVQS